MNKQYLDATEGLGDHDGLYDMQGIMRFRATQANPYAEFEQKVLAAEAKKAAKIAADKAKTH